MTVRASDTLGTGTVCSMRRRVAGLLIAIAGLGVLTAPAAEAKTVKARAAALPSFPSCPALLDFAQAGAHRTDGVPGVPDRTETTAAPPLAP